MTIEIQNMEDMIPPELMSSLNEGMIQEILFNIAEAARNEWIKLAQGSLRTSRQAYISGIQPLSSQGVGKIVIALVGVLPNLIEDGMDEVDMHEMMLGASVPVGRPGKKERKAEEGGFYRSIPFRHSGSSASGVTGQPMGRPYTGHDAVEDAKKLGGRVFKAAKRLRATGPGHRGDALPQGLAPKLRPHHATDIYAGMIRSEKQVGKSKRSSFVTFRTIAVDGSGNPVGKSPWIRPRTPGRKFAQEVGEFVQKIAPQAFQAYVDGLK